MPKMMRPMGSARPGPYDRGDRFGGPSRYGMGRGGARTFRGFVDDDNFGDFGKSKSFWHDSDMRPRAGVIIVGGKISSLSM